MRKLFAILTVAAMIFGSPIASASADDHLVSRGVVGARLSDATIERSRNLASLDQLLASPRAGQAAAKAGVDIDRMRGGLPLLSDAELRDLSRRTAVLESDPAAGYHMHDEMETLVFIAFFAAIALVLIDASDHY